jgi:predicted transglutaminase-like cysteine proteinase
MGITMTSRLILATLSVLLLCAFDMQGLPTFTTPKWANIAGRLHTGIDAPMQSMEDVQVFVNRVPYKSDRDNYGVDDYWAAPAQFFARNAGDCEDYAIAKYALGLENRLFAPEEAKLVMALDRQRDKDIHMLLVVRDRVYDNQTAQSFGINSPLANRYIPLGIVDVGSEPVRTARHQYHTVLVE